MSRSTPAPSNWRRSNIIPTARSIILQIQSLLDRDMVRYPNAWGRNKESSREDGQDRKRHVHKGTTRYEVRENQAKERTAI
jgi:hypothetical protein